METEKGRGADWSPQDWARVAAAGTEGGFPGFGFGDARVLDRRAAAPA